MTLASLHYLGRLDYGDGPAVSLQAGSVGRPGFPRGKGGGNNEAPADVAGASRGRSG
jgi:hypothetical protein